MFNRFAVALTAAVLLLFWGGRAGARISSTFLGNAGRGYGGLALTASDWFSKDLRGAPAIGHDVVFGIVERVRTFQSAATVTYTVKVLTDWRGDVRAGRLIGRWAATHRS